MSLHDSQFIGWLEQTAALTDPVVDANTDYYKFGGFQQSWGDFPSTNFEWSLDYLSNSFEPDQLRVLRQTPQLFIAYMPVNAHAFYRLLGSSATVSGTQKNITPVSPGQKTPAYAVRFETQDSSQSIRKVMLDSRTAQYSFTHNFMTKQARSVSQELLLGRQITTPTTTTKHTPIYPNSTSDRYRRDTNFAFTWDSVDYAPYILEFSYLGANNTRPIFLDDGNSYPAEIRNGEYIHGVNFKVARHGSGGTDIFDDVLDQETEFKDVVYTIYNNSTDYIKLTFTDLVGEVKMNHTHENLKDKPFYNFNGVGKALTVNTDDGLAAATWYNWSEY